MTGTVGVLVVLYVVSGGVFCTDGGGPPRCAGREGCLDDRETVSDSQLDFEVITETEKPVPPLEILSMLSEDEDPEIFEPTVSYRSTEFPVHASEEQKGRALNFSVEPGHDNNISKTSSSGRVKDLSDVSMDEEEEEQAEQDRLKVVGIERNMTTHDICTLGGLTYEAGEKLEHGCDSVCTCTNGEMDCVDRCRHPYVKKGSKPNDPLCIEKDSYDHCCSMLVCTPDTETEPFEMCNYKNKTYSRSQMFEDGCQSVCICEAAGEVSCKPRCPEMKIKTNDRCVEVPDQADPCCTKLLCDVTLDDNESEKEDDKHHPRILSATFLNTTTLKFKFNSVVEEKGDLPEVQLSNDRASWKTYKLQMGGFLTGFEANPRYAKIHGSSEILELEDDGDGGNSNISDGHGCTYNGKTYNVGDEISNDCVNFCVCRGTGVQCLKIECPTYFGVDVLDPSCVEWETVPPNFAPSPPECCPKEVKCKNNGSCTYGDLMFSNWQELPSNVTGCEKKCYCEMGKVECQNVCPAVTAFPPSSIGCPQSEAILSHLPDDDCCRYWVCNSTGSNNAVTGQFFPGFPNQPPVGVHRNQDEIEVYSVEAIDPHTIRLEFSVPPIIVGLHGRVEVRYTSKASDNLDDWSLQIFTPPDEYISTPQMEFDLLGLEADTEYKIKITVILRGLHNTPTSQIYNVRTPKEAATTSPPMIPIEPKLEINEINSTWVTVTWRKFTDYELQFVDGVQLRYKEIDGKIYQATPLIHRMVTTYTVDNLKSNTKYEIGIFFIPFPGQNSELNSEHMLHFTTANEVDTYGFNVTLEITNIKPTTVEITWYGVPYPQDKYVNIYRAIYQSASGKGVTSTFKIAKRDSTPKTIIKDLQPQTKYRLWLEVYLTNGKIKTSNVKDFTTKSTSYPPKPSHIVSRESWEQEQNQNDYYSPLVVVAIVAALAILSTIVLLMILFRKHSQNKASITPPQQRVTQSAYDNPTYKVEIQQETMGMSTIK